MKRDWLWDRKTSLRKIKRIFNDAKNPEYIRWAALLLARKNTPKEVFREYLNPIDLCRKWGSIKKVMRKDSWNNPRIVFWQAVYEKLLEKYRSEGKSVFIKEKRKPKSRLCQEIGGLIKSLRKQKGLTQKVLAAKLGVSQQLISRIEKGYENISMKTLEAIVTKLQAKTHIEIQT